jgi:putative addiction module component (TIGR02574 family)
MIEEEREMSGEAMKLLEDALHLPENERAEMAARLLESLDAVIDPEVESAWDAEIARRLSELDNGSVKPIPWEEARRRIRGESDDAPRT